MENLGLLLLVKRFYLYVRIPVNVATCSNLKLAVISVESSSLIPVGVVSGDKEKPIINGLLRS